MITFNSLLIIGGVAIAVPLLLGLVPAVKVPAVVLEILGGVLVGPAVLGWVHLDAAVRVTADLGLGFLLFMAGYEIDLRRFGRPVLVLVGRAFAVFIALALLVAYGLQLAGQVRDGLLVAITLTATSLGILAPGRFFSCRSSWPRCWWCGDCRLCFTFGPWDVHTPSPPVSCKPRP
jgi:Kef-type K+ transport system membrane component KefB